MRKSVRNFEIQLTDVTKCSWVYECTERFYLFGFPKTKIRLSPKIAWFNYENGFITKDHITVYSAFSRKLL